MKLKQIKITVCEACLNGEGRECHTPECALFLHAVDLPIHPEMYEVVQEWEAPEEAAQPKPTNVIRKHKEDTLTPLSMSAARIAWDETTCEEQPADAEKE